MSTKVSDFEFCSNNMIDPSICALFVVTEEQQPKTQQSKMNDLQHVVISFWRGMFCKRPTAVRCVVSPNVIKDTGLGKRTLQEFYV